MMCRNGVYYFYARVPQRYIDVFGLDRQFIRKSLRCTNKHDAVCRSRRYVEAYMAKKKQIDSNLAAIDGIEGKVADYDYLLQLGRELLSQYDAIEDHGGLDDMNDFIAHLSPTRQQALDLACQEQYAREQANAQAEEEKQRRKAAILADELSKGIGAKNHRVKGESKTLQELRDDYVRHQVRSKRWNDRTTPQYVGILNLIIDGFKYRKKCQNPLIHDFDADDANWFQDTFQLLPSNLRKKNRNTSFSEIMSLVESGAIPVSERISSGTYNTYAQQLTRMFEFAKDQRQRYISHNVFTGLNVDVKKKTKKRTPFNDDNLQKFFTSSMFVKKDFQQKWAWRYWIPVIMLYSGMRLEEVAQLSLSDIVEVEGIQCFQIKESYAEDGMLNSSAKTDSSERNVPLHSRLMAMGFLTSYVKWLKATGQTKLFPSLVKRTQDGKYKPAGAVPSKWFNEDSPTQGKTSYFSRQGIDKKKTGLVLYCLRHTVETCLINHPDNIGTEGIDVLMGHEIVRTGGKHYCSYHAKTISNIVERIDYPGANLPWDVNPVYSEIPFPWER